MDRYRGPSTAGPGSPARPRAARRVLDLPPYLFARLDRLRDEALARGRDLVDLGVGDPDMPTPKHIVQELRRAAADPANHRYPSYEGKVRTREAAAAFYAGRFGVELDPGVEVLTLLGTKEGLAHLPLALMDPGDLALVPDLAYPVYAAAVGFAGGRVYGYRLDPARDFAPDLDSIPVQVAARARVIFVNYPNNPTGGTLDLAGLGRVVDFAARHDLVVVSDLAYSEVYLREPPPPSILQVPGARSRTVEFFSLSKTYNMTGWRVGFAMGAPDLLAALGKVKTNVDSGVFGAVQDAAVAALTGDQGCAEEMRGAYRRRMEILLPALRSAGMEATPPRATFYVFAPVPGGGSSIDYAARLLREAGVVAAPGAGFGPGGEGFVRFSLTAPDHRIEEAARRIAAMG